MSRATAFRGSLFVALPALLLGAGTSGHPPPSGLAKSIRALQEDKLTAVRELLEASKKAYLGADGDLQAVRRATTMLRETRLEVSADDAERLQLLRSFVKDAEAWEAAVLRAVRGGTRPMTDALTARIDIIDARIMLEKASAQQRAAK